MLIYCFIGAGIMVVSSFFLYSWAEREEEENNYQAALKKLQAKTYFSICDPIILQSMMENLEYRINLYTYTGSPENWVKFLQVDSVIKSESSWKHDLILCGRTKKENDELINKYREIKAAREERYQEALRSNNDMSLHFLTSVKSKLDKVIEEEIKTQNSELEKIKTIASRINTDF